VRVAGAAAESGHISDAQAQLAGARLERLLAVVLADLPEHIGPLGITGQEHNPCLCGDQGQGRFRSARAPVRVPFRQSALALTDGADELFLGFAAVEGDAQLACHLTQLAQGHPGK
jgi:hypothetical protein